jgi:hypothetical protein
MKKYLLRIDHILMIFSVIGASVSLYLLTGQNSLERYVTTEQVGFVVQLQNDVKLKPKGSYNWHNLRKSSHSVFSDDYIYSGKNSFAQIKLKNGDLLKINSNSLVFISPDKNNSVNLIVYEGTANYQLKDSAEVQTLNKSEQINLNVRKKSPAKTIIKLTKNSAAKTEIVLAAETISMMTKPPEPLPVSLAVVVAPPPIPEAPPAEKKLYAARVNEVKAVIQPPTAISRYKGEEPVLKVEWPQDSTALKYIVKVFSKGNLNTPVYKTETKAAQLLLKWKTPGQFVTQVEKQVKLIARPPASVPNTDHANFILEPVVKIAAPNVKFPVENQLVMIESKAPIFLNWEKSGSFTDYVLNISTDPAFKQNSKEIVLDKAKNNKFDISRLPAGTWYWQIKGLSDKSESDWSRVYKFKLLNK